MNAKTITKDFDKFQIDPCRVPHYENPQQFAMKFKRCSILEPQDTVYFDSTETIMYGSGEIKK